MAVAFLWCCTSYDLPYEPRRRISLNANDKTCEYAMLLAGSLQDKESISGSKITFVPHCSEKRLKSSLSGTQGSCWISDCQIGRLVIAFHESVLPD